MPCARNTLIVASVPRGAAISIQGRDGRTSSVERVPSSRSTRTSTSVIVSWSPGNSMRLPARPAGPASTERRSSSESGSSWTLGSSTLRTPSGSFSATGRRMPASTGVRQSTLNWPGAVSLSSR